jgi:hypothetical protein
MNNLDVSKLDLRLFRPVWTDVDVLASRAAILARYLAGERYHLDLRWIAGDID